MSEGKPAAGRKMKQNSKRLNLEVSETHELASRGPDPPWCLAKNNAKARKEGSRTTTASNKRTRSRTGTASARARESEITSARERGVKTCDPWTLFYLTKSTLRFPSSLFYFSVHIIGSIRSPSPPSLPPSLPPFGPPFLCLLETKMPPPWQNK